MKLSQLYNDIPIRYPELRGKAALVTGSGRGIGKGIAIRLAREGARVVITARTASAVDETVAELEEVGATAVGVAADISTDDGRTAVLRRCLDAFGAVDVLVNNAADLTRVHIFDVDTDLLDRELRTNVRAAYLLSQEAAAHMAEDGGGRIINVSSVGGLRAHWRALPYDMTKGAMDAMTRAMALELADHNVLVNAVAPGATYNRGLIRPAETRSHFKSGIPLRRPSDPIEMGGIVTFLASDDAAYITGQILYVDGGITIQLGTRDTPL